MTLLNLNKKLNKLDKAGFTNRKKNKKKMLIRIFIILLILAVAIYLPVRGAYSSVKALNDSSKKIASGIKTENLDLIREGLTSTQSNLDGLETSLNFLFWARFIPFLGGFYSDAQHFISAGQSELKAAQIITKSLEPHKVELGLTGQGTPGQDRVAQAVKVLDKVIPELDKVEPDLKKAREEIEKVNTDKYPQKYGNREIKSNLVEVKNLIIGAHVAVTEARDALKIAPNALGQNSPKTYMLLFQNDKELRATGGFITAYAFLKLDKGHLSTTSSDDIYRLDEKLLDVCRNKICPLTPPEVIVKYLPETTGKPRSAWSMRDSNLSPDFPTSMKEFERMYQMLGEGLPFDGIISIDTQVVEELIEVTGPVEVFGTKYSSEHDTRCNCPNVIFELEKYAEITAKGEADRKAVVGALMQEILAKTLGTGPEKMPDFLNTGLRLINHKHVMFYMHDQQTQDALSKLNWTGEIKQGSSDYLHINDSNFAGGKSNLYVDEKVLDEITINSDNSIKHKLTIEYKNPQPFNIWLNGILRDYVRVYVPNGSKLTFSKGSDEAVKTQVDKDHDKTYFEAFIQVRPENSRTLILEYEVPQKTSGNIYPYLIQKQPGAKDHKYTIKVNGRTKEEFNLTADTNLNLAI